MNTLESYVTTSPFGVEEECAKFVIDDVDTPFVLHDITRVHQSYTLSLWIKSDSDGGLYVNDNTFATSTEWAQHSIIFTASGVDFAFDFTKTGIYYIYHPQLEIGNIATDYTEAPEDTDSKIDSTSDELHQEMVDQNADITAGYKDAIVKALEDYVATGDMDAFRETVNTELGNLANDVESKYAENSDRINDVNTDVQDQFAKLYGYINIDPSIPQISLGAGDSAITLTLEHDLIVFKKKDKQFGWWDGVDFHTGNIVVEVNERAQFGNFAFVPRSDGSLMFLKVSDNTTIDNPDDGGDVVDPGDHQTDEMYPQWTAYSYISDNGELTDSENEGDVISEAIDIDNGSYTIYQDDQGGSTVYAHYYDTNGVYLGKETVWEYYYDQFSYDLTIPDGAAFFRLSITLDEFEYIDCIHVYRTV